MKVTHLSETRMNHWYPGTLHFSCEDGTFIAVHADQHSDIEHVVSPHGKPCVKRGRHFVVKTRTVIIACDERGRPESLRPLHSFDPGTSIGSALEQAGYEL